jgi:chromosome segregation ATPase
VTGLLAVATSVAALAQDASIEELTKKMSAARSERYELETKLRQRREALSKLDGVAPLREASRDAYDAYQAAIAGDATVAATRKAVAEAEAEQRNLVEARLAASAEGAAALAQSAAAREQELDLKFRKAQAELELTHPCSPIGRKLEADPELRELRRAMYAPGMYASGSREERNRAREAYSAAKRSKQADLPGAQELLKELEAIEKRLGELEETRDGLDGELDERRRAIEVGDDPEIVAVRRKRDDARNAVRAAEKSEALEAARKGRDAAREAYQAKLGELLAADEEAQAITAELGASRAKYDELRKQLRAAQLRESQVGPWE